MAERGHQRRVSELDTPRGHVRLRLAADLDPTIRDLCHAEFDHIADCLAPWGRFLVPVAIASVADMGELAHEASGPVDGWLCAVAEPTRITLLRPSAWVTPPSRLALRGTLIHELSHSLLFQRCAPPSRTHAVALPTWFREGMAVLVSEGAPTASHMRRLNGHLELQALACADAALLSHDARACYDLAHLLFSRWYETFGSRRLSSLCREMRAGHTFERAFAFVCKLPVDLWLAGAVAQLRRGRHDGAMS